MIPFLLIASQVLIRILLVHIVANMIILILILHLLNPCHLFEPSKMWGPKTS